MTTTPVINPAIADPSAPATPSRLSRVLWPARQTGRFVLWILSGFGLLSYARKRRAAHGHADEIVVYTVHESFYLWALILAGFVGGACVRRWPGSEVTWGWIYLFVLLYTFVTILFDISARKATLWSGAFLLLWLSSKYLEDLEHIRSLSIVWKYLRQLRPALDPGTVTVLSWMLLIPWVGALFESYTHGRKAFSPNSIEERYLGEGREITDRSGLKFRTRYHDIFEMVLGLGAGDLEAVDNNQQVVKRWENVLLLSFAWDKLDEILHQRSAVVDAMPVDGTGTGRERPG